MSEEYEIVYTEEPAWGVIGGGIHEYNEREGGESHGKILCYVLQNADKEVVGGVIGETHWDWLYINLMWLREDLRRQGYGTRLLEMAEEEGRKRGAKNAYLDTFSFQAPEFYEKFGYQVFGVLEDFPKGHQRYYCKKELV